MLPRHLAPRLMEALADRPVVFLHGARQVGKSTLVRAVAAGETPKRRYLTLDDSAVLAAATGDPEGFVAGLDGPVAIDEVQRAPAMAFAIKASVDRDRRPGRFLLTGSANVLMLPNLADALVGRMEILTLSPLSQDEIEGSQASFVDGLLEDRLPGLPMEALEWGALIDRITHGGYPELIVQGNAARHGPWYEAYVTTILQRDVRDLAHIEGLTALPHLLALLASRPMGLLNYASLARDAGFAHTTLKRYMALLETTFMVQTIPAWFSNIGKRLIKAPKVLLSDTGLMAHLAGVNIDRILRERLLAGAYLEAFVALEIRKQIGWSRNRARLHHFRTTHGQEVDLVLETPAGQLVGIETKATLSIKNSDFRGLRLLAESTGDRFHRGILLHPGRELIPFSPRLHAVPIAALWHWK